MSPEFDLQTYYQFNLSCSKTTFPKILDRLKTAGVCPLRGSLTWISTTNGCLRRIMKSMTKAAKRCIS